MAYDITFSVDKNKNYITAKNVEYIKGIIHMLFHLRPGDDVLNPKKGIDIESYVYKTDSVLTELEDKIKDQFRDYTDITVLSVITDTQDNHLAVILSVDYQGKTYDLALTDTSDVRQVLTNLGGGIE